MDLITALMISAGALVLLLVILLVVWAMMPSTPRRRENGRVSAKEDIKNIKEEIQHEAMEEISPYRPARLSRPSRKRL